MDDSDSIDRPSPSASPSEIAQWMEEDFSRSVAEGISKTVKDGNRCDADVIIVDIWNQKKGEVVGSVDSEGNLETESEPLSAVCGRYLENGVTTNVKRTMDSSQPSEIRHGEEIHLEPGNDGFLRALVTELPAPFSCDSEVIDKLPEVDVENNRV